jgi:hypothetical protein
MVQGSRNLLEVVEGVMEEATLPRGGVGLYIMLL